MHIADGAAALTDPRMFATPLVAVALDDFGTECLAWDPEHLRLALEERHAVALPDAVYDRLMAGVALLTSDRFYKELPAFLALAPVLSGAPLPDETPVLVPAEEIAWAITEALLLAPPEPGDDAPFCDEVRRYVGAVLDAEGFVDPPDVLAIAVRPGDAARRRRMADLDPETAEAARRVDAARADEVNRVVRDGLRLLVEQVAGLPLESGDARAIAERLAAPRAS